MPSDGAITLFTPVMSLSSAIDPSELLKVVPELALIEQRGYPWDAFGAALDKKLQGIGLSGDAGRTESSMLGLQILPKDYWSSVKAETFELFCTRSKKYADIRQQLKSKAQATTVVLLGTFSVSLAKHLGTVTAIIMPLVATVLYAIAKLGVNAFCSLNKKNKQTPRSKRPA